MSWLFSTLTTAKKVLSCRSSVDSYFMLEGRELTLGKSSWIVHKFGGTSLANAERFQTAATLCLRSSLEECVRTAVVVSAMAKVTNGLEGACNVTEACYHKKPRQQVFRSEKSSVDLHLDVVFHTHADCVRELCDNLEMSEEDGKSVIDRIADDLKNVREILKAVSHSGMCPPSFRELVMGHGEIWSSLILCGVCSHRLKKLEQEKGIVKRCGWMDARDVLCIETRPSTKQHTTLHERVAVNWESCRRGTARWLSLNPLDVVIITGYICSTTSGIPTTLKRNGSDYSASIFSALLRATRLVIWTDVDGVYTADPRRVPTAFRLPFVSYTEAIELAYFGAKVLHPHTMGPCIVGNIPIFLKSSLLPESPGTVICEKRPLNLDTPQTETNDFTMCPPGQAYCKAFTMIDDITLINLEGTSMVGVPDIAHRLFSAVNESRCSVLMISQASSQHSICFAVMSKEAERAYEAVQKAFFRELQDQRDTMRIVTIPRCCMVCAVGENMAGARGILGTLAAAAAQAEVNVKAVTQGSSELNVTFVVSSENGPRALRAMHDAIFTSKMTQLPKQVQVERPLPVIPLNEKQHAEEDVFYCKAVVLVSYLPVSNENLVMLKDLIIPPQDRDEQSHWDNFIFTDGGSFTHSEKADATIHAQAVEALKEMQCLVLLIDTTKGMPPPHNVNTRLSTENFRDQWIKSKRFVLDKDGIQYPQMFRGIRESLQLASLRQAAWKHQQPTGNNLAISSQRDKDSPTKRAQSLTGKF